jgi:hypothetical protein
MMGQQNIERINVDWDNSVHVIKFAPLEPSYVSVESFRMPNNALIIMELTNEYALIVSNDDGVFLLTFKTFEELNEYLRREFGLELNNEG